MAFQFSNSISLITKGNKPSGPPPPPPPTFEGANAVWSTKLRISTYTGPCIQLRRSTDSVTTDFYANASGNLGTTVGASGTTYSSWRGAATTYVVTWYDQSGKINHITQSTQDNQPIYSDINGIIFNGSTAFLTTSAYSATLNTSNFTIIYSATNLNSGSFGTIISSRIIGPLRGYSIYKTDADIWYMQFGKNTTPWGDFITDVSATIGTRFIGAFNQSNTTNNISSNIKNVSTQVVTTMSVNSTGYTPSPGTTPTRIGAGATETTPQYFFNGYINDIFYFGKSLTNEEQTSTTYIL